MDVNYIINRFDQIHLCLEVTYYTKDLDKGIRLSFSVPVSDGGTLPPLEEIEQLIQIYAPIRQLRDLELGEKGVDASVLEPLFGVKKTFTYEPPLERDIDDMRMIIEDD